MSARFAMDERRDPDRVFLRDLYDELGALAKKIEKVAVLAERISSNHDEISRLRDKTDRLDGRVTTLEARQPVVKNENGALTIRPAWLTVILGVAGMVLTGIWQVIDWIIDLWKSKP